MITEREGIGIMEQPGALQSKYRCIQIYNQPDDHAYGSYSDGMATLESTVLCYVNNNARLQNLQDGVTK